jgi:Icc-related predicted phosphoesterase
MKIAYGSDLHFEFYDEMGYKEIIDSWKFDKDTDLIVIAGDVHVHALNIVYVLEHINRVHNIPVFYVPGNHDYYHSSFIEENDVFNRFLYKEDCYSVLLNDSIDINGITFFGCMGNIDSSYEEINVWKHGALNDFRLIKDFDDHEKYGKFEHKCLDRGLQHTEGKSIVVTHTMPSPRCINDKYSGSLLNPCFANNWEDIIYKHNPLYWICGHTHDEVDIVINDTHVLANPFGYPYENKDWEWKYINV